MTDKNKDRYLREEWLHNVAEYYAPKFEELGKPLPEKYRISCGFTSHGTRGNAIGQCWYPDASEGGFVEIFIRPDQSKSIDVAETLVHELCHAALPQGAKHGHEFSGLAKKLGLVGPWPSTTWSKEFETEFEKVLEKHGEYPHQPMILNQAPVTRQATNPHVNLRCPECDYYAKTTRDNLENLKRLQCPECSVSLLTHKERVEQGYE